jgi:hypothetical protein
MISLSDEISYLNEVKNTDTKQHEGVEDCIHLDLDRVHWALVNMVKNL